MLMRSEAAQWPYGVPWYATAPYIPARFNYAHLHRVCTYDTGVLILACVKAPEWSRDRRSFRSDPFDHNGDMDLCKKLIMASRLLCPSRLLETPKKNSKSNFWPSFGSSRFSLN